jgi:hypothetical protein
MKRDPCGIIHITIGDGGNREGLARRYWLFQIALICSMYYSEQDDLFLRTWGERTLVPVKEYDGSLFDQL